MLRFADQDSSPWPASSKYEHHRSHFLGWCLISGLYLGCSYLFSYLVNLSWWIHKCFDSEWVTFNSARWKKRTSHGQHTKVTRKSRSPSQNDTKVWCSMHDIFGRSSNHNNSGYNTNNDGYIWLYGGIITYYLYIYMFITISGWWCNKHLEKWWSESQWEEWHHIYEMENKIHVWNHQPVLDGVDVVVPWKIPLSNAMSVSDPIHDWLVNNK